MNQAEVRRILITHVEEFVQDQVGWSPTDSPRDIIESFVCYLVSFEPLDIAKLVQIIDPELEVRRKD